MLMPFLYNTATALADAMTPLLSRLPGKAGAFFRGRRGLMRQLLETDFPERPLWFHAASVGEYEQVLPVVERIKERRPDWPVVISFFSPSVYEMKHRKTPADLDFYLPIDTPSNMRRLAEHIRPRAVLFVKYEFWPNLTRALHGRDVPMYLVSGIFREDQAVLRYGFLRKVLKRFRLFFLQDEASEKLLHRYGITQTLVTGDTRFDRVRQVAAQPVDFPVVKAFRGRKKLLVAGSTWPADEKILLDWWRRHRPADWKLFIIPHEPTRAHVTDLLQRTNGEAALYSAFDRQAAEKDILIGDVKGLLKYVYRYGDLAYVGGGFGRGIHNTLEAAVYGLPVVFGPNYQKFIEAKDLIAEGAAKSIGGAEDFEEVMRTYTDDTLRRRAGERARAYVEGRAGATERMTEVLEKELNKE